MTKTPTRRPPAAHMIEALGTDGPMVVSLIHGERCARAVENLGRFISLIDERAIDEKHGITYPPHPFSLYLKSGKYRRLVLNLKGKSVAFVFYLAPCWNPKRTRLRNGRHRPIKLREVSRIAIIDARPHVLAALPTPAEAHAPAATVQ